MPEQTTTSPLVTKKGVEVRIGQRWRDCDKRMNDRTCYVVELDPVKQKAKLSTSRDGSRGTWVSVRRMYKHSTGWELVEEASA